VFEEESVDSSDHTLKHKDIVPVHVHVPTEITNRGRWNGTSPKPHRPVVIQVLPREKKETHPFVEFWGVEDFVGEWLATPDTILEDPFFVRSLS